MSATRKPAPSDIGTVSSGLLRYQDMMKQAESGAPLQPGATQPEHDGVAHETKPFTPRERCPNAYTLNADTLQCSQGKGHDGECTPVMLPEKLFTHSELTTLLERMARAVVQEAAEKMRQDSIFASRMGNQLLGSMFATAHEHIKNHFTKELLQQLREAVERG